MDLQGGPTFEDLSIDDELTQLQRLVRYSSSSIALQRLVHVKVLSPIVLPVQRGRDERESEVAALPYRKPVGFVQVPCVCVFAGKSEK